MDYEQKYKAAFKWMASLYDGLDGKTKEEAEKFFPELKESEDELTWLTKYIEEEAYNLSIDIRDDEDRIKLKKLQKAFAWLEKQGERKVMTPEEKEILLKDLKWVDMVTLESHCYNCKLFDSKNNVCKCIELCKNPKSTFKGFYVNNKK